MNLENRQNHWLKWVDRYVGIPLVFLLGLLRPVKRIFNHGKVKVPQRILVIKLSALGDGVLMLPALCLLNRQFPQAEITFLGGSSIESFIKLIPAIHRFERFSLRTMGRLSRESFDLCIDFDQWVRITAVFTGVSKFPTVWGFCSRGQGRHYAYDGKVPLNFNKHMAENFWNLARAAAEYFGQKTSETFEFHRDSVREKWSDEIVEQSWSPEFENDSYIVIHPGCGENGKQREWPLESWGQLIKAHLAQEPTVKIFITGYGPYEKTLGLSLEQFGAQSLVGQLTLKQLMKVLKNSSQIITGNTGIMHLSSFIGESLIVLNGPTDWALWGPLWKGKTISSPLACAPCLTWGHDYGCSDPVCLKVIKVKQVLKAIHA